MRCPSWIILILLLVACPATLFADGEAVDAAAQGGSAWGTAIGSVVALVITALATLATRYVGKFTAAKADHALAMAKTEGISRLQQVRYIAEAEIYSAVGELNETEIPKLVEMAADGKITREEAGVFLKGLRDRAVEIVTKRLAAQGIDLISDVGLEWVHGKIRSIVDEKSPFLGPTVDSIFEKSQVYVNDYGKKILGKVLNKLAPAIEKPAE